ncbi:MAG: GNAT family N-acetyltransferase [Oscillospiraceae bacterium]|jgi:ribosomal protein S18 acetylase RimI-like enzyme|nr:GNAT family N-acetyltransferase [Oscillospiraceae bacterium]MBQ1577682.1 GNAT family N-acetyltransferase [Oscillospiraceae bacterium]
MSSVSLIPAFDRRSELIPLYEEYGAMLLETDPVFARSLAQQNYDEEILHLEEKYAPPKGQIYLVFVDGELAGCVGMKPSDDSHAELKRLYVRPAFRGRNLGETLTRRIMDDARKAGYRYLRLDTLPGLKSALKLYRRLGFRETDPYYDCLVPGTIFMEIEL